MERLKKSFETLQKAYIALSKDIMLYETGDRKYIIQFRGSLIQNFEICFDLTWKYLKVYLSEMHGLEVASPKKVFQECKTQKITTRAQTDKLLDMTSDRNLTTHTYNEDLADQIAAKIPEYYKLMVAVIEKAKP